MGVGVVFTGHVVLVSADRLVGGQRLQPAFVIQVQAAFVVVPKIELTPEAGPWMFLAVIIIGLLV